MTTDKELLEFAAKAARYEVVGLASKWIAQGVSDHALLIRNEHGGDSVFDPLTDDGDALRLAVKLGIEPQFITNEQGKELVWIELGFSSEDEGDVVMEPVHNDPYAATRRAIVRAAAEIGKEMK